jgi:hypothetical protein
LVIILVIIQVQTLTSMTKAQEVQLSTYIAFEKHIMHLPVLLEKHPHIRPYFDIFCQQIQLILKNKYMLEESEKITNQYSLLRNELAKTILFFSRKITAFALLEELTDLQGVFCYSYEELFLAPDDKLLDISNLILKKTQEYLTGIAEYGIRDFTISDFQKTIDQFLLLQNDKKTSDLIAEDAAIHISDVLADTELLFNSKLAPMVNASVTS